jgi:hypothetical protein
VIEPARFAVVDHIIAQTFVVYRGREWSHYEIQLALDGGPKTPRLIFLTNDKALYQAALALEGTEQRVDASWRPGRRQNGQVAQVLSALRVHQEAA